VPRAFVFILLPILLGGADLKVDHVTVAARNLEKLRAGLAAVGLNSEYGGPHSNHATEMALTSFPDGSYLELIALQPNADPHAVAKNEWSKPIEHDAGPTAWAAHVNDLAAELARLQSAGVEVGAAVRNGRARPDGTKLDWEAARVGGGPTGAFFPFLIRDFTPRELRAFPQGKPTTQDFSGITRVVIAVHDLDASAARYAKAFGAAVTARETDPSFGARLAILAGTPVILATPVNSDSWLARRLDQFGEGPSAFVLGGHSSGRYQAVSKSRWAGADVSWFDNEKLGWRLGFE